jgi:hypothetical protein
MLKKKEGTCGLRLSVSNLEGPLDREGEAEGWSWERGDF